MAMRVLLCCFLAGTVSALRRGSRRVDSADQQPVRVEIITAADSSEVQTVVSAVNQLGKAAIEESGCIRFDVMQQAKDTTFTKLTNIVWYYAVFVDDAASKAFTASAAFGTFSKQLQSMADASREITNYYLPPTMETQLKAKDDTDPRILWFYGYLNDETMATRDTLQRAFWKIVDPTRAEPGNLRYDQLIPASNSKIWMSENIWYRDLPDAQNAHMGSAWMATFFVEAPPADWVQIPLKLVTSRSSSASALAQMPTSRSPAPAPAPQGAFIQYYRAPNHSDIAANMPTCDYWRPEDLGKKVPDECCSVSAWPASVGFTTDGPDARTIINDDSGKTVRCYARERVPAPGTYVRNFFGCYQGELMAAEGCAPTGTSMGHGYPLPSSEAAVESSVDGDPVSCNCEKPWYNQGPGCYVAASGYITGVSPDPTANFLEVSGSCPSGSALSQSEEQPFPSLVDQALPEPISRRRKTDADLPITADPGTMRGYTGPAENPGMVYMVMMDINEIPKYQPQCASTFKDDTIGTKLPDECCEPEKWRGEDGNMPSSWFWSGPDIMSKPGEEENWTCYPRVSPGPFTGPPDGIGPAMQWIRNYIGCEDGKLQAHENCVPDAVQYVSQAQYEAGSGWSYPMNETYALTQFEDITGDECHCSVQSHFNEGAGCYIAYAKLAQFTGAYPGVFVRVEGTCNAPPNTRRRRRRSTGRRRNLMDILP